MLISTHILDRVAARYHLRNGFSIVEFTMKKLSLHTMLHNPWIRWGVGLSLVAVAVFFYPKWWPALNGWIDGTVAARKESMSEAGEGDAHSNEEHDHAHEEDGHDHAGHDENSSLELTPHRHRSSDRCREAGPNRHKSLVAHDRHCATCTRRERRGSRTGGYAFRSSSDV